MKNGTKKDASLRSGFVNQPGADSMLIQRRDTSIDAVNEDSTIRECEGDAKSSRQTGTGDVTQGSRYATLRGKTGVSKSGSNLACDTTIRARYLLLGIDEQSTTVALGIREGRGNG